MSFTYLASPYSSPDLSVMQQRYDEALKCTKWLLERRIWTYSPVVHCHEMALRYRLPRDFGFWHDYNITMLDAADRLLILTLPKWRDSRGITEEIEHAKLTNKPVNYIDPQPVKQKG